MRNTNSQITPTGLNILLVDDVPDGTIARKSILMGLGYGVKTAESGAGALEILASESFDLMVTDYMMPGMNGIELIRVTQEKYPAMKTVMLSRTAETLGFTAEFTGADAILPKGGNEAGQLERTIKKLLAKKPARKPVRRAERAPKNPPKFMVQSS
jgi:CheY-like chemotaxis protein